MADIVIKKIEEGMTGRQVADLLYSNFLALVGAIGSGGGGDIPVADIEKGVTAYGWGDHSKAGYLKGITAGMVTGALGYTPMDKAAWTKANIKATLGIADWALAAKKPTYTTKEVAENGAMYFTDARAVAALAGVTDALAGDIGANATAIGVLQGYFTNGVAKIAAKLATSRKLWGQLFNGEADVTGALTGVTDITASGVLTIGKIKIGDGVIEWDAANGGFKVTGGLWATDYLSSKGVNTGASGGGGGGSSYQRLDTWDGYTSAKDGWVLSAKLGYGLKTTQDDILRQLADISGQGTNVTFTPSLTSGTQIGTLTIDGEPVKMYAPSIPTTDIEKGVTAYGWGDHSKAGYLTQHQDLSGYQTKITSSNKLAASLVSGLAAVATSGKYSDLSGTPTSLPASDVSAWAKAASKPTYKFSEITERPTTIGGFGITDAYTKSQVNSALGGYLPLSGGTLTANNVVLTIKRYTANPIIGFNGGAEDVNERYGYLGFSGKDRPAYIDATGSAVYPIIHSGNIGSQSVSYASDADKLDGKHLIDIINYIENPTTAIDLNSYTANEGINVVSYNNASSANVANSPYSHATGVLSFGSRYPMQFATPYTSNKLVFRSYYNGWYDWREVAFTDSNVASATKLQTARTIWGQSFDGTGNVNGKLSYNATTLTRTGIEHNADALIYGDTKDQTYIRGTNIKLQNVAGTNALTITNGNVLIGTTTDSGYKLDVNGTLNASGAATFGSTLTIVERLGVGTTSPKAKCDVNGAIYNNSYHYIYDGTSRTNRLCLSWNNDTACIYSIKADGSGYNNLRIGVTTTSSTRQLYLDFASGCWGVGTSTPQYRWDVNGVIHSNEGIFSDGYVSAKGQNTSSDMRLKRVLEEVTLSVDEIAAAPAFRFEWKGGAGVDVGTSAQYWEKLVPDAVKRDDAGWRMMQYGNVAMVALISLARKVKELEEKLGIKN